MAAPSPPCCLPLFESVSYQSMYASVAVNDCFKRIGSNFLRSSLYNPMSLKTGLQTHRISFYSEIPKVALL